MTFLNLILLGGAAAGGIPLAIHLLRRNNPRVVRWGAMQLLRWGAVGLRSANRGERQGSLRL